MGLSSKQVSGDGFDLSQVIVKSGVAEIPPPVVPALPARPQQQKQRQPPTQQQGPALKCPRCDSTNTKFCYYNNYSRTQPRHFCKACKRHWTEGGTLRNVPVGGGRKAKRPKTSHTSSAANPVPGSHANGVDDSSSMSMPTSVQPSQHLLPPISFAQDILCPALLQPSLTPPPYANSSYLGSLLSLPPTPQFSGAATNMVGNSSYSFSTSSAYPSFFDLTEHEDLAGIGSNIAMATGPVATPPPWELLPPSTCSGAPSGSSITSTSSGLTVLESSSPSSGYWGSRWEDLTGFLSGDLENPPATDVPPLHQYFELS